MYRKLIWKMISYVKYNIFFFLAVILELVKLVYYCILYQKKSHMGWDECLNDDRILVFGRSIALSKFSRFTQ